MNLIYIYINLSRVFIMKFVGKRIKVQTTDYL